MKQIKRHLQMLAAAALLLLTGCTNRAEDTVSSRDVFAMDTYMNLKASGAAADSALNAAVERITELETMFSVTDESSVIWAVNHAEGKPVPIPAEVSDVLAAAQQTARESDNALAVSIYPVLRAWGFTTDSFQIPGETEIASLLTHVDDSRIRTDADTLTLPDDMEIDLGALVKGYTGDAVMEVMREHGVTSAIVSLGGNVQALGTKADGSAWSVGVTNPFDTAENLGIVRIKDCAVITSGNYERFFTDDAGNRYWHIIDPADGHPADNGAVSVTVIGKSGLRCDALSTALFVEGPERAVSHWKSSGDFEMILVTDDARLIVTEGIAKDFENLSPMPVEVVTK